MARSEVSVASAAYNSGVAVVNDAIDLSNDHVVDVSGIKDPNLVILIQNSSTETGTATFVASSVYSEYTQGNLAVTIPASANVVVALESARFKNADEEIDIDLASTGTLTGTISAIVAAG